MSDEKIALSYSRISDYLQCPYKFKEKYLDKTYPDDSNNPAFKKGTEIHKQLENYVRGLSSDKKISVGKEASNVLPMLDRLHTNSLSMTPESQVAVNHEWQFCGWFDKSNIVKFRAIIDLFVFVDEDTALISDYKTGKMYDLDTSPTSQLKLTAAIILSNYPQFKKVVCSYLYVEHKETVMQEFFQEDLEELRKPFNDLYDEIQREEEFKFKKNKYCNWCLSTTCPVKG